MLGKVTGELVEAFKIGGGVPYSSFEKFQELQAGETGLVYDAHLLDHIITLADGLPQKLQQGIDVLEVGSGAGHALNLLAKAFPESRFVGVELSEEGTALARKEAANSGLSNVTFQSTDAAGITGSHDLILTFDVIHDLAQPETVLRAINHALKDDGMFLMGDIAASSILEKNIDHMLGPTLYMFSVFHCMTVSLSQGGVGLGTVWGQELATKMLGDAGFPSVEVKQLEGDPLHMFYICRKS